MTKAANAQAPMTTGKGGRAVAKETDKFHSTDWSYLNEKDSSENHILFHEMQVSVFGEDSPLVSSPEQWMAMLSMHRALQAAPENQGRAGFRGRTVGSVIAAANTLMERNSERALDDYLSALPKEDARKLVQARLKKQMETADALEAEGRNEDAAKIREQAHRLYVGQYSDEERAENAEIAGGDEAAAVKAEAEKAEESAIEELAASGGEEKAEAKAEEPKAKPGPRRRGAAKAEAKDSEPAK